MVKIEREVNVERNLGIKIKKLGGMSIKLLSTITGLPDRLCLLPGGRLFFVELKKTNKKPSPIQAAIHRKLIKLSFDVYVIDSTEKIKLMLLNYE